MRASSIPRRNRMQLTLRRARSDTMPLSFPALSIFLQPGSSARLPSVHEVADCRHLEPHRFIERRWLIVESVNAEHESGEGFLEWIRRRVPLRLQCFRRDRSDSERLTGRLLEHRDYLLLRDARRPTERDRCISGYRSCHRAHGDFGNVARRDVWYASIPFAEDLHLSGGGIAKKMRPEPRLHERGWLKNRVCKSAFAKVLLGNSFCGGERGIRKACRIERNENEALRTGSFRSFNE